MNNGEDVDQELLDRHITCLTEHKEHWEFIQTMGGSLNKLYICRKCNPKEEVREESDDYKTNP